MKEIPLSRGLFARVDDEDFTWLNKWKWHAGTKSNPSCIIYAKRNEMFPRCQCCNHPLPGAKQKQIPMHRAIMNPPEGMVVDHIDGNGLNNQRNNLRICTFRQNSYNRIPQRDSTSQYIGVSKISSSNKLYWHAQLNHKGKLHHLGIYPFTEVGEQAAALAYNEKAKELFGEFAKLNFKDSVVPQIDWKSIKGQRGRQVVDIITGEIYPSATEASTILKLPRSTFLRKLRGAKVNDTNYQYI